MSPATIFTPPGCVASNAALRSCYWGGFTHLYHPGEATNIVANTTGVARRELDGVLMSAESPKFLLPGLSTHLAVGRDLSVFSEYLSHANPAGPYFVFKGPTHRNYPQRPPYLAWHSGGLGVPACRLMARSRCTRCALATSFLHP